MLRPIERKMMNRDPQLVEDILDALVGPTFPEERRVSGLEAFKDVCDWVASRLDTALNGEMNTKGWVQEERKDMRNAAFDLAYTCAVCVPEAAEQLEMESQEEPYE